MEEYFSSGDIANVAESLEDLGMPVRHYLSHTVTAAAAANTPLSAAPWAAQ